MTYEEDLRILRELPPAPLPSEGAVEHIGNAQQLALNIEQHLHNALQISWVVPQTEIGKILVEQLRHAYEDISAIKRRLGWARAKVEP